MGKVLKYLFLVLLFAAFGWKIYKEYIAPKADSESVEGSEFREVELEVGDPKEMIEDFYGSTGVSRTRNGITTTFFKEAEIDVINGKVSAIRNLKDAKGTLEAGGQTFSIDDSSNIKRQDKE